MISPDALYACGALTDLDVHLARTLARLGNDPRPEIALAVALASHAVGEGHVCLDLARVARPGSLRDGEGRPVDAADWPALAAWRAALQASPLVGGADAVTPLVLDGAGRLYLRRYWRYETALAAAIAARVAAADVTVDAALLRDGLARLFPETEAMPRPNWQRVAAFAAVRRRFCVISGGPGTGKTHTVVRILALLVEQALGRGAPPPRVALLAPTGKAAARLAESIRAGAGTLACDAAVRAAIPDEARTIHRALGARPERSAQFRHDASNPLPADLVLVDEASMVDVALMAHLVAALPAAASLVLLGDQDQLASVEAGAVLGDICNSGVARRPSAAFCAAVHAATGDMLDAAAPAAPAGPVAGMEDAIVVLTHSYRYDAAGGIGRFARAVNAGDETAVFAALAAGGAVTWQEPAPGGRFDAALEARLVEGFAPYGQATTPAQRLRALERFRVLCAHRRGPTGVATLNARIEQWLAARGWLQPDGPDYRGRPILVTRNDYAVGLFNGDVGVIDDPGLGDPGLGDPGLDDPGLDDPGAGAASEAPPRMAYFPDGRGGLRAVAVARLPEHETVFALSVHKSQGSELDAVAVLLPDEPSPIVSRELVYTAVTRARTQALLIAPRAVLAHAVRTPVARASGLRARLWGEGRVMSDE